MAVFENKHYSYPTVEIAGLPGLNAFICNEGCQDTYFVEKNGYIWEISMRCVEKCDTKSNMNATQYAKDRDAFIASLSVK